jgi:hypothetical protein
VTNKHRGKIDGEIIKVIKMLGIYFKNFGVVEIFIKNQFFTFLQPLSQKFDKNLKLYFYVVKFCYKTSQIP